VRSLVNAKQRTAPSPSIRGANADQARSRSLLGTPARASQRELVIGEREDACEQEADRAAEQVMAMHERPSLRPDSGKAARPEYPTHQQPSGERRRAQTKRSSSERSAPFPAPPSVHEALRSPSQPLEQTIRAFMEPRFGHDFSGVRVHADAKAAESARAVNAQAYTVGSRVVFGATQYNPHTLAGRRLLAHELAHVIQQGAGTPLPVGTPMHRGGALEDAAAARLEDSGGVTSAHGTARRPSMATTRGASVQRKYTRDGSGWLFEFTVGDEISPELAAAAVARTRSGPLGDGDLAELRAIALSSGKSIDDNERMFLAALLDGQNAADLQKAYAGGSGRRQSITFADARISWTNRGRVRDFDRDPEEKISMQLGRAPGGVRDQILGLADQQFAAAARQLVQLAATDKVPLQLVYQAMLAAASDSTPGDRVLAGAAYVMAKRTKLQVADDLLRGNLKVDEVPSASIKGTANYFTTSSLERKGDTLYLPSNFDVASVAYQGLLVHELTHAARDKAASGLVLVDQGEFELEGYRAQGRYWLERLVLLKGAALSAAIAQLAPAANDISILAMMIEQRTYPFAHAVSQSGIVLIDQINRSAPSGLKPQDWSTAFGLSDTNLEAMALRHIRKYDIYEGQYASVGGLHGDSFLDE
jgi:hypothetical protein